MKIICVGRNYTAHAKELNNDIPTEPVLFMKPKTALLLPGSPLYYPEFTKDLHYECELVIKMSKNGKFISEKFARKYYNSVGVGIDFTARDVQEKQKAKGLPWEIAKAFDGSAAGGRFLPLTEDMNINNLNFRLEINGKTVQRGNSAEMTFSVDRIIAYASRYFTLNIGDIIFTGTPAGVGPVHIHDRLEGFIENQSVLNLEIK
jgi:acylpyruvate hydrolase